MDTIPARAAASAPEIPRTPQPERTYSSSRDELMKNSVVTIVAVALLRAQATLPPPFPRTNATKLLDTDRIAVCDIVWPNGQPTAMHRHVYDQAGTYYSRGARLIS